MKKIFVRALVVASLALASCRAVTPAIQTTIPPYLHLTGQEKYAVLPFKVKGYPPDVTPATTLRVSSLVELALQHRGLLAIPQASFRPRLEQLQFQPPADQDIPAALLLRKMTGADIVIEGTVETAPVGVGESQYTIPFNSFKETIYAIDGKYGELIATTHGEGDSDIYVNCAQDLADKLKRTIR